MHPDRWKRIEEIYHSALEQPEEERSAFLGGACGRNEELLREVAEMLEARGQAGSFLTQPAAEQMGLAVGHKPEHVSLSGKRLGVYEVGELIGAGGMGQVYRALDARLRRDVAIKVLPDEFAQDAERVARFEREAMLLASLNHPNIAAIHGLEEHQGERFLVLELVEGRTLAERLRKGRIPLDETLDICRQIAEGLESAHEKGVIHRDLKPSNVKVTPEGKVKILDFGLAKTLHEQATPSDLSRSPTIMDQMTVPGLVLGTAAYMSPEQAEGKKVDVRSDIFSLGSVLYEMVTGRRAFEGGSRISTLSALLHQEPTPISGITPTIPAEIERLINRCLCKDPERRIQHIGDVKLTLLELKKNSDSGRLAHGGPTQIRSRPYLRLSMVLAAGAVLAVAAWAWLHRALPSLPQIPMAAVPLITYSGEWGSLDPHLLSIEHPSFSPDGNEIVFAWNRGNEASHDIYRNRIGPGEPLRLTTNSADDIRPAWSRDGRLIAFLRVLPSGECAVYLIPSLGGPERRLTEAARPHPPTLDWSPDNKWLVISDGNPFCLCLVSVETGAKRRLTNPPRFTSGDGDASFSPDGHTLVFVRSLDLGIRDIYCISLTDDFQPMKEPERLTYENRDIQSPVWTRSGKEILYSDGAWWSTGRIVRRLSLSGAKGQVRSLAPREPFGEDATDISVSYAANRLVYTRSFVDTNIYRFALLDESGRVGLPQKFIASSRDDSGPEYSLDGRSIALYSTRSGTQEIWVCNADGSNPRQLTSMGGPLTGSPGWSPDGLWIGFDSRKEGNSDLYIISPQGGPARRLTSHPSYEGYPRWSRDGKWIYFHSDRTGCMEVYKIPAGGGEIVRVTKNGGAAAVESPDGKRLIYCKEVGDHENLYMMPVGGGEERKVASEIGYFAVADNGVYFHRYRTLEFFDFKTGKIVTGIRIERPWEFGLTISPDHRWLLSSVLDQALNDLMLVENFH
jgi:eukaryotic-like serine/threonine-protein kinase